MGNVHEAIQIKPQYYEGVAIEIDIEFQQEIKKIFNSLEKQYSLMYFHLKEVTEETQFFCDSVYKHKKMYLVLQSDGKSGWGSDNLVPVFKTFAPYLNNSLFYVDDECEGFVDRYEIKNKKLVYKRVAESESDIFTYLEKNEIDKEILYTVFIGRSISLKKYAEYWKKKECFGAAEDDYNDALLYINKALKIKSNSYEALFQKALLRYELREAEKCIKICRKYILLKGPDQYKVFHLLALSYNFLLHNPDEAKPYYQKIIECNNDWYKNYAKIALSDYYFKEQNFNLGISFCNEIINESNDKTLIAHAYYQKALAYARQNKLILAFKYYTVSVSMEFAWSTDDNIKKLINYYAISQDSIKLTQKEKKNIIETIITFSNYEEDIDKYIVKLLGNCICSYPKQKQKSIIYSLPAHLQLLVFASSPENTKLLSVIESKEPVEYIKKLLKGTEIINSSTVFSVGKNIANVEIENNANKMGVKIIEGDGAQPLLGAQLMELAFDLSGVNAYQFVFVCNIYEASSLNKQALNVWKKAVNYNIITSAIIAGILYNASILGKKDIINKYLEFSLNNKEYLEDPYCLSNVLYCLNRRGEQGDKEASKTAVKLTEKYWNNISRTIPSLFVNMTDSFIVAEKTDDIFEQIIDVAEKRYIHNPDIVIPALLVNLAAFYAMKKDTQKALNYMKKAKTFNIPGFNNLFKEKYFSLLKNDKEFKNLFFNK